MDDFELEIKRDFLSETNDLLEKTEQFFLELEKDASNSILIDSIFRFAHNLKGTSRAVGFGEIAELTHVAESLLLDIKQGKLQVNAEVVSVLLEFNDQIKQMIEGLKENIDAKFDCSILLQKFKNLNTHSNDVNSTVLQPAPAPDPDPHPVPNAASNEWNDENFNVIEAIKSMQTPSEITIDSGIHILLGPEVKTSCEIQPPLTIENKKEVKKEPRKEDETIRVALNRLEKLNDMVGELVILQSLVEASLSRAGEVKLARSLSKLSSNIQDLSMSLRMVPIGPSFQKLTRVVRDTSKLLNKKVELRLIGEQTEIDKTVAENLGDPLVHIT